MGRAGGVGGGAPAVLATIGGAAACGARTDRGSGSRCSRTGQARPGGECREGPAPALGPSTSSAVATLHGGPTALGMLPLGFDPRVALNGLLLAPREVLFIDLLRPLLVERQEGP